MHVVVDANILFAALIKNAYTRKLFKKPQLTLYTPDYIREEFSKYQSALLKKSGLSTKQFEKARDALFDLIEIVETEQFNAFLKKAISISPDKKDAPYLALCMARKIPLWSNDKALKKQKQIKVYNTKEMEKLL